MAASLRDEISIELSLRPDQAGFAQTPHQRRSAAVPITNLIQVFLEGRLSPLVFGQILKFP